MTNYGATPFEVRVIILVLTAIMLFGFLVPLLLSALSNTSVLIGFLLIAGWFWYVYKTWGAWTYRKARKAAQKL